MLRIYASLVGLRAISLVMAGLFVAGVAVFVPTESFGRFSLVMSVIQVLGGGILSFGNHALLRYGREDFAMQRNIGNILAARLIVHGILLLCTAGCIWFFFPFVARSLGLPQESLPFIMVGLAIIPLSEMGTFALQASGRFTGYGISPVLFRGIQLGALGFMAVLSMTSWVWLMIGTIIGHFGASFYTWSRLPRNSVTGLTTNMKTVKRLAAFGWSIPLATLSMALVASMDLWFVEVYHGSSATGSYAWSYTISLMMTALLVPLGAVLIPRVIDFLSTKNEREFSRIMSGSHGAVIFAMSLSPALAGTAFAMSVLFDLEDYQAAVIPSVVLIGAAAFQLGTNMWEPVIFATDGCVHKGVTVLIGMAIMNAFGNWMLVPSHGGVGAAVSTSASFLLGAVGLYAVIRGRSFSMAEPGWGSLLIVGTTALVAVCLAVSFLPFIGAGLGWCISITLVTLGWWFGSFAGLAVLKPSASTDSGPGRNLINILAWLGASCKQGR